MRSQVRVISVLRARSGDGIVAARTLVIPVPGTCMKVTFALLADYATQGLGSKLTIVGTFDTFFGVPRVRPIRCPRFFLVAGFEGSVIEGSEHPFEVRVVDEDGHLVVERPIRGVVQLTPRGPGRRLGAHMTIGMDGLVVPDVGEYSFELWSGGSEPLAVVSLVVADAPSAG